MLGAVLGEPSQGYMAKDTARITKEVAVYMAHSGFHVDQERRALRPCPLHLRRQEPWIMNPACSPINAFYI
jgi:hypothetical protein